MQFYKTLQYGFTAHDLEKMIPEMVRDMETPE
jgi:hypothetical protein